MIGLIVGFYVIMWVISAILIVSISCKLCRFFDVISIFDDPEFMGMMGVFWPILDICFIMSLICGMVSYYMKFKTLRDL
jgi:hypothetical protein